MTCTVRWRLALLKARKWHFTICRTITKISVRSRWSVISLVSESQRVTKPMATPATGAAIGTPSWHKHMLCNCHTLSADIFTNCITESVQYLQQMCTYPNDFLTVILQTCFNTMSQNRASHGNGTTGTCGWPVIRWIDKSGWSASGAPLPLKLP